jgi:hypothetical protein
MAGGRLHPYLGSDTADCPRFQVNFTNQFGGTIRRACR